MAKGKIACFEQFLLLSLCFHKPSAAEASESVYMRERDKLVSESIQRCKNVFVNICSLVFIELSSDKDHF